MPVWFYILFLFTLGACVGSFLNVVVWRLPRGESLIHPPSRCPHCETPLKWYDNLPVIGWIKLGGRCRYCNEPISPRYPIVEAITGLLFVFYYVMFYIVGIGPCPPNAPFSIGEIHLRGAPLDWHITWPIYFLYMFLIAGLLAASLVDFELFIIPEQVPIALAIVGILVHAIVDKPNIPGALNCNPTVAALGAGGGVGLIISMLMRRFDKLPKSFPLGDPILEVDRPAIQQELAEAKAKGEEVPELPPNYTRAQIRAEMRKEMLFLMPPMLLAALAWMFVNFIPPARELWSTATSYYWVTGMLGAVFGGLVGGFVVWITRILGTLGFGKVAMGLGDVDLMFGVGCIIGAGAATVAFFLAPFFGIILALYLIITRQKREIPYGPYLSMATAFVIFFSCPILAWLTPGMLGLRQIIMDRMGI